MVFYSIAGGMKREAIGLIKNGLRWINICMACGREYCNQVMLTMCQLKPGSAKVKILREKEG